MVGREMEGSLDVVHHSHGVLAELEPVNDEETGGFVVAQPSLQVGGIVTRLETPGPQGDQRAGRVGSSQQDLLEGEVGGSFVVVSSHVLVPGVGPVSRWSHHHNYPGSRQQSVSSQGNILAVEICCGLLKPHH